MNKWDNYERTLLSQDDARRREEAERERLFRSIILDSATRLWDYLVTSDGYKFCSKRGAVFDRFDESKFQWPNILCVRVMTMTVRKNENDPNSRDMAVNVSLRFTDGWLNISNIKEHSSIYWHDSYFAFSRSVIDKQSGSQSFTKIGSVSDVEKYFVDKLIAYQRV
jgi:hypothetical protein